MIPSINTPHSSQSFFKIIENPSNLDVPTILFNCREVKNEEDVKKICPSVIQILSNFDEKQLGEFQSKFLPELLNYPTPFEQQALSLALANRYAGLSDLHNDSMNCLLQAMHYYAKAMQIATIHESPSLKEIHASASSIFIKLITLLLIKKEEMKNTISQLINMTEGDVWAFQIFEMHINRIDLLKGFCLEGKDCEIISNLYLDAINVCNSISSQSLKNYASSREKIKIGMSQEWLLPVKYVTERYWEALKGFREVFKKLDTFKEQSPETIRKFQKEVPDAFKILFSVFLNDVLAILGSPPSTYSKQKHTPLCFYDIRAMGSAGREEICPYSDLEFMILIQDEKHLLTLKHSYISLRSNFLSKANFAIPF